MEKIVCDLCEDSDDVQTCPYCKQVVCDDCKEDHIKDDCFDDFYNEFYDKVKWS
jgi:hypothetical protein